MGSVYGSTGSYAIELVLLALTAAGALVFTPTSVRSAAPARPRAARRR